MLLISFVFTCIIRGDNSGHFLMYMTSYSVAPLYFLLESKYYNYCDILLEFFSARRTSMPQQLEVKVNVVDIFNHCSILGLLVLRVMSPLCVSRAILVLMSASSLNLCRSSSSIALLRLNVTISRDATRFFRRTSSARFVVVSGGLDVVTCAPGLGLEMVGWRFEEEAFRLEILGFAVRGLEVALVFIPLGTGAAIVLGMRGREGWSLEKSSAKLRALE